MSGWKYNTIVYQREGWLTDFPRMSVDENDRITVWFNSRKIMPGWNMHATAGRECFSVRMRSLDKGLTWELASKEPLPGPDDGGRPRKDLSIATARLSDGSLVYLQSRWIFTSESEAEELKKTTHVLEGAGPGQVAYMSRVHCYRLTDGGRTWDDRELTEIEGEYVAKGWRPQPGHDYSFCGVPYIGLARFTSEYVRPIGPEPGRPHGTSVHEERDRTGSGEDLCRHGYVIGQGQGSEAGGQGRKSRET